MANNCQIPTPTKYANELLDYIDYNTNLYNKSVLENSCGEGFILKEIVKRYIKSSLEDGYNKKQIIQGLERHITGYDIDPICIKKCIKTLDLVALEYGLKNIKWNIKKQDYLVCDSKYYQYIIANPPYITYHDLSIKQRKFLKENFYTCKEGRFDYYYAFIEAGLRDLADNGKLVYIIPYSILRNKFAQNTRNIIKNNLNKIIDYKGIQVFPNIIISSIVILCDKQNRDTISYYNKKNNINKNINKIYLENKWIFEEKLIGTRRFGDYFKVSNSVATLYNKAFIFEENKVDDKFYYLESGKIEKNIVFNAASTKSEKKYIKNKKRDKIIFPYKIVNGSISHFEEIEFKNLYPECYKYLKNNKSNLLNRKSNDGVKWFEYGRTQAINNIFINKLIISTVITNNVKVYEVSDNYIPYAGAFIYPLLDCKIDLKKAKKILESDDFFSYIEKCGTPTTTSSYRISIKDIENYYF